MPKLIRFVGKALLFLVLFSVMWYFIAPGYARALASVTDAIAPRNARIVAEGVFIAIYHTDSPKPMLFHTLTFQAGLVLSFALIAATPGPKMAIRIKYLITASTVVFVLHVISFLLLSFYGRTTVLLPLIVLFASVGVDLFPILIWMGLSAKYWWPGIKTTSVKQ